MSGQMAAPLDERGRSRVRTGPAMTTVQQQCWASLFPDDLLALIYSMLASPRGRVRFAAVCRSWRTAARTAPPAVALPWLLLSSDDAKYLHCPEDGAVMRLLIQNKTEVEWINGGHDDGWVVSAVFAPFRIVNLFSGAELALSEKQQKIACSSEHHYPTCGTDVAWKTVCSESPTSGDCILASKTAGCGIALCRVGCPEGGWTIQGCLEEEIVDIAFCNGELYGLHCGGELVRFEIGMNEHGAPVVTNEHTIEMEEPDHVGDFSANVNYIFDIHGKLAIAVRTEWSRGLEPFFKVFEIVDIQGGGPNARYEHKWQELTSLGDHALFLGETLSKVVHAPANTRGGVQRNCIYYMTDYFMDSTSVAPSDELFLTISNDTDHQTYYRKYDVADDDVKRIRSVGYFAKKIYNGGTWILPPDRWLA